MNFKDHIEIKGILDKLMEYTPGRYPLQEEVILRRDADKVVIFYDGLPSQIKKQFLKGQVLAQYDFIKENIPIENSLTNFLNSYL